MTSRHDELAFRRRDDTIRVETASVRQLPRDAKLIPLLAFRSAGVLVGSAIFLSAAVFVVTPAFHKAPANHLALFVGLIIQAFTTPMVASIISTRSLRMWRMLDPLASIGAILLGLALVIVFAYSSSELRTRSRGLIPVFSDAEILMLYCGGSAAASTVLVALWVVALAWRGHRPMGKE